MVYAFCILPVEFYYNWKHRDPANNLAWQQFKTRVSDTYRGNVIKVVLLWLVCY